MPVPDRQTEGHHGNSVKAELSLAPLEKTGNIYNTLSLTVVPGRPVNPFTTDPVKALHFAILV